MAESVIERAARALCENPSEDPNEMIMMMMNGEMWPRWRAEVWRVEAVLNAIREPTGEMCADVHDTLLYAVKGEELDTARLVWERMIEVALA